MDYLWLKALHVTTFSVWIGGMLILSLAVSSLPAATSAETAKEETSPSPLIDAIYRWNRWVTSPAMLLAWGFGIALALQGDWFGAPWLWVKLVIITALSALHGALAGRLRRLTGIRDASPPSLLRFSGAVTIVSFLVVAILAVAKPL